MELKRQKHNTYHSNIVWLTYRVFVLNFKYLILDVKQYNLKNHNQTSRIEKYLVLSLF
jgi:hypothetical protein